MQACAWADLEHSEKRLSGSGEPTHVPQPMTMLGGRSRCGQCFKSQMKRGIENARRAKAEGPSRKKDGPYLYSVPDRGWISGMNVLTGSERGCRSWQVTRLTTTRDSAGDVGITLHSVLGGNAHID